LFEWKKSGPMGRNETRRRIKWEMAAATQHWVLGNQLTLIAVAPYHFFGEKERRRGKFHSEKRVLIPAG